MCQCHWEAEFSTWKKRDRSKRLTKSLYTWTWIVTSSELMMLFTLKKNIPSSVHWNVSGNKGPQGSRQTVVLKHYFLLNESRDRWKDRI